MTSILRRTTTTAACLLLPLGLLACGDDDDTATSGDAAVSGVTLTDAWARTSAEGQTTGAAYLTITGGATADRLVAASAPASVAIATEIHEVVPAESSTDAAEDTMSDTEGMDGAMTMRPVDAIDIPAGQTVTLEPGGYHVMLIDLAAPLAAGDTFDLELTFENAGVQSVTVEVRDDDRSNRAGALGGSSCRRGERSPSRHAKRWATALVLVLGAPACSAGGGDESAVAPVDGAFIARSGESSTLATFAGRPLVVNFFAAWCAPCVGEMPAIEAVHQELGGQVAFLGLSIDPDSADGWAMADAAGVSYELGHDADSVLFHELGGVGMPTTVLIDAAGAIVDIHTGALTEGSLGDLIATSFGS